MFGFRTFTICAVHCFGRRVDAGFAHCTDKIFFRKKTSLKLIRIQRMEEVKRRSGKLHFLFRLAFICNIFFIICIIMRYSSAPQYIPQPVIQLSIILGWTAPLVNFINFVAAIILIPRLRKKPLPLWLLYTNIICFIIQIYFFFILHDTQYT